MTKRFLTITALMVATLMGSSIAAQAADVSFSGQLRPRWEHFEQGDFRNDLDATQILSTRIRLNADVKMSEKIGAFIQFQARGVYGSGTGGGIPDGNTGAGSRNAAIPADDVTDVGLHQAYFTVKDLFNMPVNLKMGRQEVILDGHRLFGNTGWTQGAQSSDAIRLDHHHGDHTISYIYIKAIEATGLAPFVLGGNSGGGPINLGGAGPGGLLSQGTCTRGTGFAGGDPNDSCDRDDHVLWANLKGLIPNSQVSLYFVYTVDQSWNGLVGGSSTDNDTYTLGGRIAGQIAGLDYRGELYYQGGDANGIASVYGFQGAAAPASGSDRSAWMFGARIGKTFKNVSMKPGITLWYDYLSGTTPSDAAAGDWKTFDTLYDTGHKYYGFMDTYLNATGADTNFLGLQDLALKASISPRANLKVKLDWHHFRTAALNTGLGHEIDLTVVHKYSSNMNISVGWSTYMASNAFHGINTRVSGVGAGGTNDDEFAQWAYVMLDLKF